MGKRLNSIILAGAMLLGLPLATVQAGSIHVPTELSYYDTTQAYTGVTIFSPFTVPTPTASNPNWTYMIDMDGRLVHKWPCPNYTIMYGTILENGNLLRCVIPPEDKTLDPNALFFAGGGVLEEVDWWGNMVWSFKAYTAEYRQSHDLHRIWNKKLGAYTTLFVAGQAKTVADAQALGATNLPPTTGWSPNAVYEVDMNGNIVWVWSFYDHTCQSVDSSKSNYIANVANAPGRLDINLSNTQNAGPVKDWNHINSMDYNADLDYIVINSRNHNEFYVIDHGKTFVSTTNWAANKAAAAGPDGDFVYRFGAPMNYNQGARPTWGSNGSVQIWGAHQIQFIQPRAYTGGPVLPGAGNFIIWDNHSTNNNTLGGPSEIKEINPFVSGKNGSTLILSNSYVNPPLADYSSKTPAAGMIGWGKVNASNQVVWSYGSSSPGGANSSHISGCQRLPNGNSMGTSGEIGHIFEVNRAGALVWEYVNPVANGVPVKFMTEPTLMSANQVFRSYRYDVNHPGLKGKVRQYWDGRILPTDLGISGVGYTLTGQAPCRSIPCITTSSSGGSAWGEGGGGGGGGGGGY